MTAKYGETLYFDSPHRPKAGSFCKPKVLVGGRYKSGIWHYCREIFQTYLYNLDIFFFSHEPSDGQKIAAFMRKVEEILDVQPRSSYGPTQRKTILWVKPSKWWTIRHMRRSFYTLMLRVGKEYSPEKDNFREALFSDKYTSCSRYAVERFLSGYTIYTGKKHGWFKQFGFSGKVGEVPISQEEVNKLLVLPK